MMATKSPFLVIGGSSGIGAQIVEQLRNAGRDVLVACRHPEAITQASGIEAIAWDATADEFPRDRLPEHLAGLAYCPGSIRLKPFARLTDDDFHEDWQTNFMGAVRAVRAALPALKRNPSSSSIVLFSTVAVAAGMSFHASISSAKGALEGLSRSLAAEFAPQIRVNTVAPSLTDTPLAGRLLSSEERREASAKRHPLQRIGDPEEVARTAVALLDGQLSWMTGQILRPDGGLSSLRTS